MRSYVLCAAGTKPIPFFWRAGAALLLCLLATGCSSLQRNADGVCRDERGNVFIDRKKILSNWEASDICTQVSELGSRPGLTVTLEWIADGTMSVPAPQKGVLYVALAPSLEGPVIVVLPLGSPYDISSEALSQFRWEARAYLRTGHYRNAAEMLLKRAEESTRGLHATLGPPRRGEPSPLDPVAQGVFLCLIGEVISALLR